MTPKEFLIERIKELVNLFPDTKARYENHELSNTHFIEVVPNEFYRLNDEYKEWEEKIVFQFIEQFPSQNVCFISDDAIVGIDNCDYEISGVRYNLQYSLNELCFRKVNDFTIVTSDNSNPSFTEIVINSPDKVLSRISAFSYSYSNNSLFNDNFISCDPIEAVIIDDNFELDFSNAA